MSAMTNNFPSYRQSKKVEQDECYDIKSAMTLNFPSYRQSKKVEQDECYDIKSAMTLNFPSYRQSKKVGQDECYGLRSARVLCSRLSEPRSSGCHEHCWSYTRNQRKGRSHHEESKSSAVRFQSIPFYNYCK